MTSRQQTLRTFEKMETHTSPADRVPMICKVWPDQVAVFSHPLAALFALLFLLSLSPFTLVRADAAGREKTPKPTEPVVIPREPLGVAPGKPLSSRTLVTRPPVVRGMVSWTIETRRHRGYVFSLAVSPDGKRFATGGIDGMVR